MKSRSFGHITGVLAELREAIRQHAARAGEKQRCARRMPRYTTRREELRRVKS